MQHYFFKYPLTLPNTSSGQAQKGEPEPPKRAHCPLGVRANNEEIFKKQRVFLNALLMESIPPLKWGRMNMVAHFVQLLVD